MKGLVYYLLSIHPCSTVQRMPVGRGFPTHTEVSLISALNIDGAEAQRPNASALCPPSQNSKLLSDSGHRCPQGQSEKDQAREALKPAGERFTTRRETFAYSNDEGGSSSSNRGDGLPGVEGHGTAEQAQQPQDPIVSSVSPSLRGLRDTCPMCGSRITLTPHRGDVFRGVADATTVCSLCEMDEAVLCQKCLLPWRIGFSTLQRHVGEELAVHEPQWACMYCMINGAPGKRAIQLLLNRAEVAHYRKALAFVTEHGMPGPILCRRKFFIAFPRAV